MTVDPQPGSLVLVNPGSHWVPCSEAAAVDKACLPLAWLLCEGEKTKRQQRVGLRESHFTLLSSGQCHMALVSKGRKVASVLTR